MKKAIILLFVIMVLVGFYLLGPKLPYNKLSNKLPNIKLNVGNVEEYVVHKESALKIKPDNEARILWNDSLKQETDYSILYLHGFSACWYEGNPSHINIAKALQANMYLCRLAGHGLVDDDAMLQMEPSALYESAKEALLIANTLGKKTIVVGTSTGGTLALKLAADFPNMVHSMVLLSPNIEINSSVAGLLGGPWGLQIARLSAGGNKYRDLGPAPLKIEEDYWSRYYPWEATIYLQQLINETMIDEIFSKVNQPLFLGYYYKDEENQDPVVKVDAMHTMFDAISTSSDVKIKKAFPNAGTHVIGCSDLSGASKDVEVSVIAFLKSIIDKVD